MQTTKPNISELPFDDIVYQVERLGEPKFRAKQIYEWLFKRGANSFEDMDNLPKTLRAKLNDALTLTQITAQSSVASHDGSKKYLLEYADGTSVECVGMPHKNKLSVCVSTQAGCRMGCAFCATGQAGFTRSLTASEIYKQVLFVAKDFDMRVTNVVFMGQGEPFCNYQACLTCMKMLNDPSLLNIGARHITVSTCGIVPMIYKFAQVEEQFTLAISLHSATQATRDLLMPGVKKYSLSALHEALSTYTANTGRRPTYEYTLIQGINDTQSELEALIAFCKDTLCHVNLIRFNEIANTKFKPSSQEKAEWFMRKLQENGIEATIRNSRGNDIDGACGQLKQRLSATH